MFLLVWNIGQTGGDASAATRTLSCSPRHAFRTFYLHECFSPLKYCNTMREKPQRMNMSRAKSISPPTCSECWSSPTRFFFFFFCPELEKQTVFLLRYVWSSFNQKKKTRRQDGARNNFTCHYLDCDGFMQSQRASHSFPLMSCVGLFNFTWLDSFHQQPRCPCVWYRLRSEPGSTSLNARNAELPEF